MPVRLKSEFYPEIDGMERLAEDARVSRWLQTAFTTLMLLWMILGVLLWKWDVRVLVWLYWSENLIIGLVQVSKMLLLPRGDATWRALLISRGFFVCFFVFHFGMFCAVHGFFLVAFSSMMGNSSMVSLSNLGDWWGPFKLLGLATNLVGFVVSQLPQAALWSLCAMICVHLVQLVSGRREWRNREIPELMVEPYKHIVVVHLAILLGAFFVLLAGNSLFILLIMVIGKYMIDLREIWGWKKAAISA